MMVVGALKQAKKDIKRFNPHSPSLQTFTFRIYIHREDTLTHPRKDLGVSLNYNELIANVQRQVISFPSSQIFNPFQFSASFNPLFR